MNVDREWENSRLTAVRVDRVAALKRNRIRRGGCRWSVDETSRSCGRTHRCTAPVQFARGRCSESVLRSSITALPAVGLTRSPPPPPPPALNSPDKAVIGCLRIYWGRSPPMEMRNIIAFRCSIMGRGIAARPCAAFTFGTLHTRIQANRLHRKGNRTANFLSLSFYYWSGRNPFFLEAI